MGQDQEKPVIEEKIEIRTADGTSEGFLYRSEASASYPGVIHLTDIGGIRPAQEDMARRLAAQGYAVLMPNAFYRTGKPPLFDASAKAGDERMKRFAELSAPPDRGSYYPRCRQLRRLPGWPCFCQPGHNGRCGLLLHRQDGAIGRQGAAGQDCRGCFLSRRRLATDAPDSPHLALPAIRARLYFGHATNDRSMPAEAIARLDQALQAWGGQYESEVYGGASHGWTVPDSPAYNQPQAERAFEKLTALFAQTLG